MYICIYIYIYMYTHVHIMYDHIITIKQAPAR